MSNKASWWIIAGACAAFVCIGAERAFAAEVRQDGGAWTVETARLKLTVDAGPGRLRVMDKTAGYEWRQPADGPAFRHIKALADGIAFEAGFADTRGGNSLLKVTMQLPDGAADLRIEADMQDRGAAMQMIPFLQPLMLDAARGVLAVADYSNGHIYPLDLKPFPAVWLGGDRLNMPWVGICDLERGHGYALILETPEDAVVESKPYAAGGREVHAPRVLWQASKGRFGHPRRYVYRFCSEGGYVALAKAYRAYARERGLIVTLEQKAQRLPNIRRLYGAVDVWGAGEGGGVAFAREARAAGVERMILHGKFSREAMQAMNELGYLTSDYDNYTDIEPLAAGGEPDSNHDQLPGRAVLNADGERMKAWLTYDKKTQFMKRCPAFWVPTAKVVIPKLLKEHPFLGRFIDVTTAEGLYECYDAEHPLTRAEKRRCGEELLAYVHSLGLVAGGEHGIWWAVPHVDYIEGMMSSYQFAWPAGHLIRPKSREEKFSGPYGVQSWEAYDKWGIGHEHRVPLWELVFHDCVVSTWYWGEATDWLMQVDKSNAAKKDAFNILYGTVPLLWANEQGSWKVDRALFLRSCRNTSRLHRAVASQEMLSHEFVTPDRAVQRTRFGGGTEVVVNFGSAPAEVEVAGRKHALPPFGFVARGPKIEQSLTLQDGRPVTRIKAEGYEFSEPSR